MESWAAAVSLGTMYMAEYRSEEASRASVVELYSREAIRVELPSAVGLYILGFTERRERGHA